MTFARQGKISKPYYEMSREQLDYEIVVSCLLPDSLSPLAFPRGLGKPRRLVLVKNIFEVGFGQSCSNYRYIV